MTFVIIMPARRTFLGLIASLAGASYAQRAPQTIGMLLPYKEALAREHHETFVREMLALGYAKSRLNIVLRISDNDVTRLTALAEDLAKLKVALVVAVGSLAVEAARRADPAVPIVFISVANPVGQGMAESLARPGRNITGLTNFSAGELVHKRFELLRQLMPNMALAAYLVNPTSTPDDIEKRARDTGDKFGFRALVVRASSLQELEPAFQAITAFQAQAVYVPSDGFFAGVESEIAKLSLRNRVASVWASEDAPSVGGLMSYSVVLENPFGRVASYAARILQGEKAGDLPIQEPSKFRLVINRKTATALGLKIPQVLVLQADQIIE